MTTFPQLRSDHLHSETQRSGTQHSTALCVLKHSVFLRSGTAFLIVLLRFMLVPLFCFICGVLLFVGICLLLFVWFFVFVFLGFC